MRSIKHRNLWKSVLFLLILSLILSALSALSIQLDRNPNPLFNFCARDLLQEPENTIDTLVIGTSDAYSGVSPLVWWNQHARTVQADDSCVSGRRNADRLRSDRPAGNRLRRNSERKSEL